MLFNTPHPIGLAYICIQNYKSILVKLSICKDEYTDLRIVEEEKLVVCEVEPWQ